MLTGNLSLFLEGVELSIHLNNITGIARDGGAAVVVSEGERGFDIFLENMSVIEDRRGEGVGTEVMKEIRKYLKDNNLSMILLAESYSTQKTESLIRWYKSLGFREVEEGEPYLYFDGKWNN